MRKLSHLTTLLLVIGALVALSGCSSSVSTYSGQNSTRTLTLLANSNWVLETWKNSFGDKQEILAPAPTLTLGHDGRVSGQSGVNIYTGAARVYEDQLDWGSGFALTRRAGPAELMKSENLYLNDLRATHKVTVRGNKLVFTGDKPLRLEFVRATN